jgi:curved DNA-binding protein CbpA
MAEAAADPYAVLGVPRDVSDVELRRVYRALVKRHHPDHNGGSVASATRFAQIQQAYALIAGGRRPEPQQPARPSAQNSQTASAGRTASAAPPAGDPLVEQRLRDIEQQMEQQRAQVRARELQEVRERAKQAADRQREAYAAIAAEVRRRPTPEELGHYSTDDSFGKIVDDASEQIGKRLRESDSKRQFSRRLSELFGRGR